MLVVCSVVVTILCSSHGCPRQPAANEVKHLANQTARNVEGAAQGTQEGATSIGSVRIAADYTGQSATGLLDAVPRLRGNSDGLKGAVGTFLHQVRSDD
jgi:methyl-accepting chemotaxis protein